MKQRYHIYMATLFLCGITMVCPPFSSAQTNKTHITLQHHRPVRAMKAGYVDVWTLKSEDRLDGSLLATAFFQNGLNGRQLGRALSVNNQETIYIKPDTKDTVDSRFITRTPGTAALSELTMETGYFAKHAGVMFSYFQHLDGIEEGFYAAVHIPVVVSHRQITLDVQHEVLDDQAKCSLFDYFAGKEGTRIATNLSEPLMYGKIIKGHHLVHGISDVELLLGYNFLYDSPHYLALDFRILFPTGTEERAEKVFEPVVGTRRYVFGMGFNGIGRLINKTNHRLSAYFDANIYFVMKGFEKRILGIKNIPFGQYYLAAKLEGSGSADIPFVPAAHLLAREVKINGLQFFEGTVGMAYRYCNTSFDFGYGMYYRGKERLSLKEDWTDNEYGIPQPNITSDQVIANNVTDVFLPLNKDVLDFEAASSEEQLTHTLYCCFSHTNFEVDYPITLSVGGLYEHAHDPTTALTGYEIFFKAGISF